MCTSSCKSEEWERANLIEIGSASGQAGVDKIKGQVSKHTVTVKSRFGLAHNPRQLVRTEIDFFACTLSPHCTTRTPRSIAPVSGRAAVGVAHITA